MAALNLSTTTVGSSGRNYATIALWIAAAPAGGSGTKFIGQGYADSNFDESNLDMNYFSGANQQWTGNMILMAADGEAPVLLPNVNADANTILTLSVNFAMVDGWVIDGANQTGASNIGMGATANRVVHCTLRNAFGYGVGRTAGSLQTVYGCLIYNCDRTAGGWGGIYAAARTDVAFCTVCKNRAYGIRGTGANDIWLTHCLSFGHTTQDVDGFINRAGSCACCYISDTSYTVEHGGGADDWYESQNSANFFTNYGSDDYTLSAGSTARQVGDVPNDGVGGYYLAQQTMLRDITKARLQFGLTDRFDIGCYQPSYYAAGGGGGLIVGSSIVRSA
jgi:hypothetical protein